MNDYYRIQSMIHWTNLITHMLMNLNVRNHTQSTVVEFIASIIMVLPPDQQEPVMRNVVDFMADFNLCPIYDGTFPQRNQPAAVDMDTSTVASECYEFKTRSVSYTDITFLDAEVQTDDKPMSITTSVQTEKVTTSIQTEKPAIKTTTVQTEKPAIITTTVQTEKPAGIEMSIQTEKRKIQTVSIQTEKPACTSMSVQTIEPDDIIILPVDPASSIVTPADISKVIKTFAKFVSPIVPFIEGIGLLYIALTHVL